MRERERLKRGGFLEGFFSHVVTLQFEAAGNLSVKKLVFASLPAVSSRFQTIHYLHKTSKILLMSYETDMQFNNGWIFYL